jgi:hypothetical protein
MSNFKQLSIVCTYYYFNTVLEIDTIQYITIQYTYNMNVAFKKDVPISGMDIFEFKDQIFAQPIPDGFKQCQMLISSGDVRFYDDGVCVGTRIDKLDVSDSVLCAYTHTNQKTVYVVDILVHGKQNYANTCLHDRICILEPMVHHFGTDFVFVKPIGLDDVKTVSGHQIRFVKDTPTCLMKTPSMVLYDVITCNLVLSGKSRLMTSDGVQVLKKFKLKNVMNVTDKVVTIKIVKNSVVVLDYNAVNADSYARVKKCVMANLFRLCYDDILYFSKHKQLSDSTPFLNKDEIGLVTAMTYKTDLLKYSKFEAIKLDTNLAPEFINQLSALYENSTNRLAVDLNVVFPAIPVKDILARIPYSLQKVDRLDYILGHSGCIICNCVSTVFRCDTCKRPILCKECVTVIGTKHKFQCKFCSTKHTLTDRDLYMTRVKSEYNYANVPLDELFPDTGDNESVWVDRINNVEKLYKNWINSVSLFSTSKSYSMDISISINFGRSNDRVFYLLLSKIPFKSSKYIVCGSDVKHIFNTDKVWTSSYKKNTIRSVKETKYGIKFALKYDERVPHEKGKLINGIAITEYICKFNNTWSLVLRHGINGKDDLYTISMDSKCDDHVNETIHDLLRLIY